MEKIKRIVVGADMSDNNISIPSILDTEVNEGDTITFDASIQGATVRIGGNYPQTARVNGGQFTWTTQKGEAGIYHAIITYDFGNYIVTRIVKITVNKVEEEGIDYSRDWVVTLADTAPKSITVGEKLEYKVETLVPVDGFGVNVLARDLPKGATYNNRVLTWLPGEDVATGIYQVLFDIIQPGGKKTTVPLTIYVSNPKMPSTTIPSGGETIPTTGITTLPTGNQSTSVPTSEQQQTSQSTKQAPTTPEKPNNAITINVDKDTKITVSNVEIFIPRGTIKGDNTYVVVQPVTVSDTKIISKDRNVISAYEMTVNGTINGALTVKINIDKNKVKDTEVLEAYVIDKNNRLEKVNTKATIGETVGVRLDIAENYGKIIVTSTPITNVFKDVKNSWAQKEIAKAVNLGIVNGYPDATFRPKGNMTRAEVAVVIARALNLKPTNTTKIEFADKGSIPQWAQDAVRVCAENGIIKGISKEGQVMFNADKPITRLEFAVIVARVLKLSLKEIGKGEIVFTDKANIPAWAQEDIGIAVKYRIIRGYQDNTFRATNIITREEAVTILSRLLDVLSSTK